MVLAFRLSKSDRQRRSYHESRNVVSLYPEGPPGVNGSAERRPEQLIPFDEDSEILSRF